ncbi:hypothetical protein Lal_00003654 [Lupinus albus]|nr:hypothetical protein Lal_00003654 [Lupinus albus]
MNFENGLLTPFSNVDYLIMTVEFWVLTHGKSVKKLRGKEIPLVKVLWSQVDEGDATWEVERDMWKIWGILQDSRLSERRLAQARVSAFLLGFSLGLSPEREMARLGERELWRLRDSRLGEIWLAWARESSMEVVRSSLEREHQSLKFLKA